MKKIAFIPVILIAVLALFSCLESYSDSRTVIDAYVKKQGVSGRIYSSTAGEVSEEYMSPELRSVMFGDGELPLDFTIFIHSRLDSHTELGAFIAESGDEGLRLCELAGERLELLRRLVPGDGEVMERGNLVIYYFGENKEEIKDTLLRILS